MNRSELQWLVSSIVQNTVSSGSNEVGGLAVFATNVACSERGQVIAALRELIYEGRFYVKSISSWDGRFAIIFKGRTGGALSSLRQLMGFAMEK
ncbi:MAG: hypothetical protein EP336_16460 [Rhodobacteraceae bacterium]|uniref:hypothetical protein n=1 Tax=Celeribacter ethanolicus TaxID=1758178 RepID=UPI0012FE2AF3|nr:hypothetical protein [Celeribacter ethanolicus]TNE63934.1 MAG: hypothetical protein EP336_16460 [Paracoccaceae bacterium]